MQAWGLDSSGSEQGAVAGFCDHGDDLLCCTRCRKFLDRLTSYQTLKKEFRLTSYLGKQL